MADDDRESERQRPLSAVAYLFNEARSAVQDVRQKVFEEPWFGRAVTGMPVTEIDRSQLGDLQPNAPLQGRARDDEQPAQRDGGKQRPSFEEVWGKAARDLEQNERGRDRDGPGIER